MSSNTNDTGIAQNYLNTNTSTQSGACGGCPKTASVNSTPQSSTATQPVDTQFTTVFFQMVENISKLSKDILRIEKEQDKTREFYKATSNLIKTSRIALIVFLIVPLVQVILCTAVVYYLGIQDELSGLLKWVLSTVTAFSFVEVTLGVVKFYNINERIDSIEKKVDKFIDKEI